MAVAYRSSTSYSSIPNTSTNVTLPTGATAGDMLVAYYAYYGNSDSGGTVSASSSGGMSRVGSEEKIGSDRFFGVYRGILNSTDISNNYVTVTGSNSYSYTGKWFFVCVSDNPSTSLLSASAAGGTSSTPSFSNSITPLSDSGISLLFISSDANVTGSSYAIATDNPTYTEIFDTTSNSGANYISMHIAYSNTRTSSSATGNSSCTLSGGSNSLCFNLLIENPRNVTVTGSTGILTLNGNAGTVTGSAPVTGSTGILTLNGNAGTFSNPASDWLNMDKSSNSTFNNIDKS